ncbi:MAG TPA: MFS transporter, partial [Rhodopila sp.]|nr:MFS transporter [Rhodopila sp.]
AEGASMSVIGLVMSRRLGPLTVAQACGALNDNLVKNAMVVLALFRLQAGATGLSALAGTLFIAPYILLSATAGVLADRFAKHWLIRVYKIAELLLMLGAAAAFLAASVPALLAVLFGLGVQAALFGPVKYGVLPEYLADAELLGGNAVVEATTFLAIVCGTVAGGGLILLEHGAAIVGLGGVALSTVGLAAAWRMPPLQAAVPRLALDANVVRETWRVVGAAQRSRVAWLSILGLSWFWTMGATVLTELPVIVRDTLRAEGAVLTLLLGVFAVGVGVGSLGCTRLLRGRVSPRLAPAAGVGISVFCAGFAWAAAAGGVATVGDAAGSVAGWRLITALGLLAACGGVFSVPLYAIIQEAAEPGARARMVAANNVMNALFMVFGAAAAAGMAAAGLSAPQALLVAAAANGAVAVWLGMVLGRRRLAG